MLKPKQHLLIAGAAFVLLLFVGFISKPEIKDTIRWAERPLVWSDFPVIDYIVDDYEAQVHSAIYQEGSVSDGDLTIFAAMNPNFSGRVEQDTLLMSTGQLLIHEQYHFNISEYCARLFRKEAVEIGRDKLTSSTIKRLLHKYTRKLNELQDAYDTEADHNLEREKQRYWELKIDDLLRQTAYYEDENLFNYQNFSNEPTTWYRTVHLTHKADLLTGYPESKAHSRFGEIYNIHKTGDTTHIRSYKNGSVHADSFFEAEYIVYIENNSSSEIHLYNADGTYDTDEAYSFKKYKTLPDGSMELTYYDSEGYRVSDGDVYKITRKWNPEKRTLFSTYLDEQETRVPRSDGPYHELRTLDSINRTTRIEYYDQNKKPVLDDSFIWAYEYQLNDYHDLTGYKVYNTNGELAYHTGDYSLVFIYDERGELIRRENRNSEGDKNTDADGVCAYTYQYDIRGNLTDSKKFNAQDIAVIGQGPHHHSLSLFDDTDRIVFEAQYYPGYVLYFTDEMWGASRYRYEKDSIKIIENLDAFNTRITSEEGIATIRQRLNGKKQIRHEFFYDLDGNWAKTTDSVNGYTYQYNEQGLTTETASIDSLQKPRAHTADVAITRWEYDSNGNKIKTTYYNVDNELANALQDVTYNTYRYDSDDVLLERSNYDRNMQPQELDGVYKTKIIPNRFGKDSIIMTYTKNNTLKPGVSKTLYTYNDYGTLLSERYLNSVNQPIHNSNGVHEIRYRYSDTQAYLGYANYGTRRQKINDRNGVWSEKRILTPSGFISTVSYYDVRDQPVIGPDDFHQQRYFWNKAQEITRISTYGTDNKLKNDSFGIADYVYQKHPSSMTTRISYYDKNHNLVEDEFGVAEYYYTPSLNGLYYLEKQVDSDGNEVPEEEQEMDHDIDLSA